MRTLHLVGLTEDRRGLVVNERADGQGRSLVVPVDGPEARRLLAAAAAAGSVRPRAVGGRAAPGRTSGPPPSGLTPREIQAHLRAGRSVAEVAVEAGVDEAHIERWSPPVAQEQDAALRRAWRARLDAGRRGPSSLPLGAAVEANLRARGGVVPADDAGWSAYLGEDGWVVRFRAEPGGSSRRRAGDAEWTFERASGALVVRNRAAAALGWVGPDGPRARRPRPSPPPAPQPAAAPDSVQEPLPIADPARSGAAPGAQ